MIVIIDNYDSFTYNLFQYISKIVGDVRVYRNNQIELQDLISLSPEGIVLSPGPGHPDESGISKEVLQYFHDKIPILGICLGHQIIVEWFGGSIVKGKQPIHGKVTKVKHNSKTTFRGVPNPTKVTRYHSLVALESRLPDCLEVSATSCDGAVMAIRHKSFNVEGIQFHPESILTEYGYTMLENFFSYLNEENLNTPSREVAE